MRRATRHTWGGVALLCGALSCRETPGFLMVRIDSDLGSVREPGGRLSVVQIEVTHAGQIRTRSVDFSTTTGMIPGDHLVEVGPDVSDRRVGVTVTGLLADGQRLRREFSTEVAAGETQILDVFLASACLGTNLCPADSTCGVNGRCEAIRDPPLRLYTPLSRTDGGVTRRDVPGDTCVPPRVEDGGRCFEAPSCVPFCPVAAEAQSPTRPAWRVTYFQFSSPETLTQPLINEQINVSLREGSTRIALQLDVARQTLTAGPVNVQLGTLGRGLMDGTYRFYGRGAASGTGSPDRWMPETMNLTPLDDRLTGGPFVRPLAIPCRTTGREAEFPVDQLVVRALRLGENRACLGSAIPVDGVFNECTSSWRVVTNDQPTLEIEGKLIVDSIRRIEVSLFGATVCSLIAGADCANVPMNQWRVRPDADVGGRPAWTLRARLAAVRAHLADDTDAGAR